MHFMCTYRTLIQPWFSSFVSGVCDTSLYFCFRKLRGKSENFCNTEKTATPKAVRQIQNRQSSDACSIPGFMLKYCGECRCICWMHKICEDVCHVGISQEAWSKDTHNYAVKRLAISSRIFYLLSILQKVFYNTCVSRFQIPRGATFWKQQRIQKGFVWCACQVHSVENLIGLMKLEVAEDISVLSGLEPLIVSPGKSDFHTNWCC